LEKKNNSLRKNNIDEKDLNKIIEFLETIQYGSVTVIVQDGKIMQIERNEKIRVK
jgi:Uncharacterized small protein